MAIEEMLQSFWAWFVTFSQQLIPDYILPNLQLIVQIVVLLIIGYVVGRLVKLGVVRILAIVGLKKITTRTWAESMLKATGYKGTIVELIGDLVKWLVYILFLALIIQVAGLPGVADIFTQIAIFIPSVIGAMLVLVIGFIIADFFGKVFEEAGRRFFGEPVLSRLSGGLIKYTIALIAIIMALSLIGLDTVSLTIMFTITLGTIVLLLMIGVKDMFPNFSAGLHLSKALKPGEKIKVGEHSGTVEKVEALSVTLKTKEGTVSIPNSVLLNTPIIRKRK